MKRLAAFITFAVFLGFLTNIAVAWSFACYAHPLDRRWSGDVEIRSGGYLGQFGDRPEPANHVYWQVEVVEHRASFYGRSTWFDPDVSLSGSFLLATNPPESLIPAWAHFLRPPEQPTMGYYHVRTGHAFGYPCLCLWYGASADRPVFAARPQPTLELIHAITLQETIPGIDPQPRALPLAPIWNGLVINTVAFASGWLFLIGVGPFFLHLRRMSRRRRGLCACCSYPSGQSDVCSECGATYR